MDMNTCLKIKRILREMLSLVEYAHLRHGYRTDIDIEFDKIKKEIEELC